MWDSRYACCPGRICGSAGVPCCEQPCCYYYTGGNGGAGGRGGGGSGGGILLDAHTVVLERTAAVESLGGDEAVEHGGTVKVFTDGALDPGMRSLIRAGRVCAAAAGGAACTDLP